MTANRGRPSPLLFAFAQARIMTEFRARIDRGCPELTPGERSRLFEYWRSIPHRRMDIAFSIIKREGLTAEEFFRDYEPSASEGWELKVPEVETMHEMTGWDS